MLTNVKFKLLNKYYQWTCKLNFFFLVTYISKYVIKINNIFVLLLL